MSPQPSISADVRAAIAAFLDRCQKEAQPFATAEAVNAIRRIYPGLGLADADLLDAITCEASIAGFEIDYDPVTKLERIRRKGLEIWDNEGGAIGQPHR